MDDSKTFREELAIQYPTLGRPLWEPDPGGLYNAVQVGDVGFIRHGYFYCLFNALPTRDRPSDHPPESDPDYPHYLQQIQLRTSNHIRTSRDHGKDFRSRNVTEVSREPNIYASGPDDDTQVTYSCSGKQGALLYLPFPAEREDTIALGDFGKWMVKNIYDCMRLAEDRGLGVNRMEDIILVTGRHLARSWARAVFSESRGGARVSFCVQVSGDSLVRLEERNVSGAQLKLGPNGEDPPENQCIFVRGYHVGRVLNIWPRLRGLAGPAGQHEPDPESDAYLQLIGVPADDDYPDPLHTLSEYIAEHAPACDMVLVHDDDLKCIEGAIPPPDTLQPDALMGFFRAYAPTIHQFQCEISPGSESESETEVAIATIATLSQNVFEVPLDEGDISRSTLTYKMTCRGYVRPTEEIDGLDEHISAAEQGKHSTPDDAEDQFKMQAYTQRQSLPYPTPSGSSPSFLENAKTLQGKCVPIPTQNYSSPDPHSGGFPRMFRLNDLPYTKLIVHALKYPHETVNGLLLGQSKALVEIVDAVPLQHYRTYLSPGSIGEAEANTMDVGLRMTTTYAHSCQLHVVGFYEVPKPYGETTLSKVGECFAAMIKETDFSTPVVLVHDRSKLYGDRSAAFVSYVSLSPSSTSFHRKENILRLGFNLRVPSRAWYLACSRHILDEFGDFRDYQRDNKVDFLLNGAILAALNSPE